MTNVGVISAVTLHSSPQILERVDALERNVADVHLAQQNAALQSAQLYRPASLDVRVASHQHHTRERRGSLILAAL